MIRKILLGLGGGLLFAAGSGFAYMVFSKPKLQAAKDIRVEVTPARLARGKYVFEILADCAGCHSERDWSKFSGPVKEGRLGAGFQFPPELGLPGAIVAPNLTPDPETGLGAWTDGEKIRAIREGIGKDGRALFPFMPYASFRNMSDDDVSSVVVYLNSLPPIRNSLPRTQLNFPVNYLIKSAPAPVTAPVPSPSEADPLRYGEYLVTMAGCGDCHTQQEKGEPVAGMAYAGGFQMNLGHLTVQSANITPEMLTGIGSWDENQFVAKFRNFGTLTRDNAPLANQSNFTIMPWMQFSKLPESDLRAIYAFLRTIKPVRNAVEPHKPVVQP